MIQLPPLTYRAEKGSALTQAEGDENLRNLRNAVNALAALFGISFNDDGTLKSTAIGPTTLQAGAYWFCVDSSGVANTITGTLDPAITAYSNGMTVKVEVANAVTGATTANFNGVGAKKVFKLRDRELVTGDIEADQVVILEYNSSLDGGSGAWQMQSQLALPIGIGLGASDEVVKMNSAGTALEYGSGFLPVYVTSSNLVNEETSTVTWSTLTCPTSTGGFPASYRFAIIQIRKVTSDSNTSVLQLREDSGGSVIDIVQRARTGGGDTTTVTSEIVFMPLTSSMEFDYQITAAFSGSTGGWSGLNINIIGYVA